MEKYIKGIIVFVLVCAMSAVGEEAPEKKEKHVSVRISLGSAPGIEEEDFNGFGSGPVDSDDGGRLEILAVQRFFGANDSTISGVLGGGIFFAGHSGEYIDISAFGGMIQGGLAAKAGDSVVLELSPYFGLGSAKNEIAGFSDGRGPYAFFGIKGGAFIMLSDSVELGLELGYEGFSQEQEFVDEFGDTFEVDFSGNGLHAAGVLAVKF